LTTWILFRLEMALRAAKVRLQLASHNDDDTQTLKWYNVHSAIEECINKVRLADGGKCEGTGEGDDIFGG